MRNRGKQIPPELPSDDRPPSDEEAQQLMREYEEVCARLHAAFHSQPKVIWRNDTYAVVITHNDSHALAITHNDTCAVVITQNDRHACMQWQPGIPHNDTHVHQPLCMMVHKMWNVCS